MSRSTKKQSVRLIPQKVDSDKSKIKFSITLEGEWDWNKDFAEQDCGYSLIDEYHFKAQTNFKQALLNYVWGRIQDTNLFETAKLNNFEADQSVINSYQSMHNTIQTSKIEKAKQELKEAEEKVARLKAMVQ